MAKKNMPTADKARHVARPAQGAAKGPARQPVRTWGTSVPGWNAGRKSVPRAGM